MLTTILTIDDSTFTCSTIETILASGQVEVASVHTAGDAFEWLKTRTPDLILLDLVLPDMDGYEVCSRLIGQHELTDVPIIFLTSNNNKDSILRGFDAGAADYITKPFHAPELKARVFTHLKNKRMTDDLRVANQKLEQAMAELRLQGMKDPLTQLYNRRYFLENMTGWKTTMDADSSFLALVDIDDFKQINDVYGHCAGDYALYTTADILLRCIGENAVAGRWGGDEFLVILIRHTAEEARAALQRAVDEVAAHPYRYDGADFRCHITVGLSGFDPAVSIESNLEGADRALYMGKRAGKNGLVLGGARR